MASEHFDVAIIGGRVAGASLALRLAGSGLKILLVDRATFPSLPNVPSSPFIYPPAMRMMRELGIDERDYAQPGAKIEHLVLDFAGYFSAVMPTSIMQHEYPYLMGIDRRKFDHALWQRANAAEGVTAREGFAVKQIVKDETGAVIGLSGKTADGPLETFTADLVVGADGRFSFAARQFSSNVIEERNDHTTAVYHVEWENVDDYAPGTPNAVTLYNTNKGIFLIVIPIGTRKYIVSTYMKSADAHFGADGVEKAYDDALKAVPHMTNRLKNASRATELVGMRPVENGYRQAFGRGWALVGDALHYKDPFDGQGMFDALTMSKLLAQTIGEWKQSGEAWETAGARYQQRVLDATHLMFTQTVKRVKQNVHSTVPPFIIKTLVRWTAQDPEYQAQMFRYLSRETPAFPGISPKAIFKGMIHDLRGRGTKNAGS